MDGKKYFYSYQTIVRFDTEVMEHHFKLRCMPYQSEFQLSESSTFTLPEMFWRTIAKDTFGNSLIYGGTTSPHKALTYISNGIIDIKGYTYPAEENWRLYLFHSRLTYPTEELKALKFGRTGNAVYDAQEICHWVHNWVNYVPNSTNMDTTAADVYSSRCGVCQDYAHLMLSICRCNGIAARYVNGFVSGIGLTHAWVEVCDGSHWFSFDPTNDNMVEHGYIKVAHGRDASDCPVSRGLFKGQATQVTDIIVTVQEL